MKRNLQILLIEAIKNIGNRAKEKTLSSINKSLGGNHNLVVRD